DTTVTYKARQLLGCLCAAVWLVIEVQATMRRTGFKLWLLALIALAVSASTALAQDWTPFGPSKIRYDFGAIRTTRYQHIRGQSKAHRRDVLPIRASFLVDSAASHERHRPARQPLQ